jgi:hypothetical protein
MNHIDKVYFINLDHRRDRCDEFVNWIRGSGFPIEKVERIQAFNVPGAGYIGCLASHILTLRAFLKSGLNTCMVCEDDFMPLDITNFWDHYERLFKDGVEFDVVMATYNMLESENGPQPYLKRVLHSFSTPNYLITREFALKLLATWEAAMARIIEKQPRPVLEEKMEECCTDIAWMPLMKESKWYCFYPRIGKQRDSFSDIQGHYTTYEC